MYKALLVASDGEWTTGHRRETVDEVIEALCDQGSRWYFYPFHAVIRDNGSVTRSTQRLVSCAWPFEEYQGRTVRTFTAAIANTPEKALQAIIDC